MADDPYRYFRPEAREIAEKISLGVLSLEKGDPPRELVPDLLRLAHTLKGAARVVRQGEIADAAHAIEGVLEPLRNDPRGVTPGEVERLLTLVDEISSRVTRLSDEDRNAVPSPAGAAESARPPAEILRTVRTDVSDVDVLIDSLAEVGARLGSMQREASEVERARKIAELLAGHFASPRSREPRGGGEATARIMRLAEELRGSLAHFERQFAGNLETMSRELREAQTLAQRLRLVPAGSLFPSLERTARDVAAAQSREVELHTIGGDIRIDADVLSILQPALVQLVRNAVAHGIESPAERAAEGKTRHGNVTVSVSRHGKRTIFRCEDDGRGVDVNAVRRVAMQSGRLRAGDENLGDDAVLQVLFSGGVTTSSSITQISGRGIGLDIVREAVSQTRAEIAVRTRPGEGTVIDLSVPMSLASVEALLVRSSGVTAAIPVASIAAALRLDAGTLTRTAQGESLVHDGLLVPLAPLSHSLGLRTRTRPAEALSAVILRAQSGTAAVVVEQMLGTEDLVMRPLPPTAPARAVVVGAAFDPHGTPQLVLDPDEIVREVLSGAARGSEDVAARPLPILVIDDSLTTRMLEQSILESAGFEVHAAGSAEEALEMTRRNPYSLFLVDVEMPGMDGFTFVERTRADAELRQIPAILVTSRNAPDDRRRGIEAGASAYIVKSEFDQTDLLEIIRKLVA
jgi:two-component system, chemotaxis family, sensor kinase CheA